MVFLVAIFFIKNKLSFTNEINQDANQAGLIYGNETLEDLVHKDTDADGVLDWEESLWGTDPKKRDTNEDGTPDGVEIAKIKLATASGGIGEESGKEEKLTQTDKFSRELFSTVATLNQAGAIDQTTVDTLSSSLVQQIQNSTPRKVFTILNLKITSADTAAAIQNYANALTVIFTKYAIKANVTDILGESITTNGDIDTKVLNKLDPIIKNMNSIVSEMLSMSVPQSIAPVHLKVVNGFQKLTENLSDVKLVDIDIVVAISAISQYQKNDAELKSDIDKLSSAVNQGLNN